MLDAANETLKESKTCRVEEKTRGFVRTWKLLRERLAELLMLKAKTVGRRFILDKYRMPDSGRIRSYRCLNLRLVFGSAGVLGLKGSSCGWRNLNLMLPDWLKLSTANVEGEEAKY